MSPPWAGAATAGSLGPQGPGAVVPSIPHGINYCLGSLETPGENSGKQTCTSWKEFYSFSLYFGTQILYIIGSWGTKPTKNPPNPTPCLLYYLFFQCCPNLTRYRKSWDIPQRHCEGCLSGGTFHGCTSLSQTHPDCIFSLFRRFPSLHAPLLLSKERSLTSWGFQV